MVRETYTGRADTLIALPGGIQIIYNDDIAWFQLSPLTGEFTMSTNEMLIRFEAEKCFLKFVCDSGPQEYLGTRLDIVPYFYLNKVKPREYLSKARSYLSSQEREVFCYAVTQLFSLALPPFCSGFSDEVWFSETDTSVLAVRSIYAIIGRTCRDIDADIRCSKTIHFMKPPLNCYSKTDTVPVRAAHRISMWGDTDSVKVVALETTMAVPYRRIDDPLNRVRCVIELRKVEPFLADLGWYTGIGDDWSRIPVESIPPFRPNGPPQEVCDQ